MSPLISVETTAKILGVSKITVYRMLSEGELSYVAVRGRKMIKVADLEKWVEQNTIPATAELRLEKTVQA